MNVLLSCTCSWRFVFYECTIVNWLPLYFRGSTHNNIFQSSFFMYCNECTMGSKLKLWSDKIRPLCTCWPNSRFEKPTAAGQNLDFFFTRTTSRKSKKSFTRKLFMQYACEPWCNHVGSVCTSYKWACFIQHRPNKRFFCK